MLKQDYKDKITREEAVELALKVLTKTMDSTSLTSEKLELAEVFFSPTAEVNTRFVLQNRSTNCWSNPTCSRGFLILYLYKVYIFCAQETEVQNMVVWCFNVFFWKLTSLIFMLKVFGCFVEWYTSYLFSVGSRKADLRVDFSFYKGYVLGTYFNRVFHKKFSHFLFLSVSTV